MAGIAKNPYSFLSADRAPGKRQVKPKAPTEDDIVDMGVFGGGDILSDSSDDGEFAPKEKNSSGESSGEEESSSESSTDNDEGDEGEVESTVATEEKSNPLTAKPICNLCLNMRELPDELADDVAECDGCGIAVHECCYGQFEAPPPDSQSSPTKSKSKRRSSPPPSTSVANGHSESSDSVDEIVEPWFCDVCVAGVDIEKTYCELCPNRGDLGRWVHLMCALYTNGVAFGNVVALNQVSLYELEYKRFGAKPCAFCTDKLDSRVGVTTECDAGWCKKFFHITCAENRGLLVDQSTDQTTQDPYFGYCRQHCPKEDMYRKQRRFSAAQRQYAARSRRAQQQATSPVMKSKLAELRKKHAIANVARGSQFKGTERWPRYLHTSAHHMSRMLDKCQQLHGISRQQWQDTLMTPDTVPFMPPAFAPLFISFFEERQSTILPQAEAKLTQMEEENEQLRRQIEALETASITKTTQNHNKMAPTSKTSKAKMVETMEELKHIYAVIGATGNKKFGEMPSFAKELDRLLLTPRPNRASSQLSPSFASPISKSRKRHSSGQAIVAHTCHTCEQTCNQHLLTYCSTCAQHYHLACLDPPLTRMPPVSHKYKWECSRCACGTTSEEDEDNESTAQSVETDAPGSRPRRARKQKLLSPNPSTKKLSNGVDENKRARQSK